MNLNNQEKERLIKLFQDQLDSMNYLVYEDTLEIYLNYSIIKYQSRSMVMFGAFDENTIYGIGILMYRNSDQRIIQIDCHSNVEEQIRNFLKGSK